MRRYVAVHLFWARGRGGEVVQVASVVATFWGRAGRGPTLHRTVQYEETQTIGAEIQPYDMPGRPTVHRAKTSEGTEPHETCPCRCALATLSLPPGRARACWHDVTREATLRVDSKAATSGRGSTLNVPRADRRTPGRGTRHHRNAPLLFLGLLFVFIILIPRLCVAILIVRRRLRPQP